MIVIAIMAVFAGIAIPNYLAWLPTSRLNGAARQVMGDLMAARMKAVSQNNEFKIFFLANGHEYIILDDDDNDGTADTGEWTKTKDIQNEYHDVTFSTINDPIFHPRGTASFFPSSFGTTITLSSSSGSKKDVKIRYTGRVKIE